MSDLTNAEIVAVKLFGWRLVETGEYYRLTREGKRPSYHLMPDDMLLIGEGRFPDFTDERLAPYWCDRMQRELAAREVIGQYSIRLHMAIPADDRISVSIDSLLATPAQRLEAAVRVLDEVEL